MCDGEVLFVRGILMGKLLKCTIQLPKTRRGGGGEGATPNSVKFCTYVRYVPFF